MKKIENRLRRLQGQITSLENSIANEADCTDVIPQFLAVKGAMQSAFVAYMEESLTACSTKDTKKLQALLATLIKH